MHHHEIRTQGIVEKAVVGHKPCLGLSCSSSTERAYDASKVILQAYLETMDARFIAVDQAIGPFCHASIYQEKETEARMPPYSTQALICTHPSSRRGASLSAALDAVWAPSKSRRIHKLLTICFILSSQRLLVVGLTIF